MSNNSEWLRDIKAYINTQIAKSNPFTEGIITEVFKNAKKVRVKPLGYNIDDDGHIMRLAMPMAGNGSQVGGMPSVGTKVLIIFFEIENKWEHCMALAGIFDANNNISPDKDTTDDMAKKDKQYFIIKPQKEQSSIEIYTDMVKTTAKKDNIENVLNGKKVINVAGGSKDKIIHLGEECDSEDFCLVKKAHLDKYDNLLSELSNYISSLRTLSVLGDLGVPLPFVARGVTFDPLSANFQAKLNGDLKENGLNKTAKVRGA